MIEDKATKLWIDIGGIAEMYLDELEAEAAKIAAKASKLRRRVKYGALITGVASLSAAVAFMFLRPKLVNKLASKAG